MGVSKTRIVVLAEPPAPIRWMRSCTNVDFVQGQISRLNPDQHVVIIEGPTGEEIIGYDYLVNALGTVVNQADVPGAAGYVYALDPSGTRSTQELRLKAFGLAPRVLRGRRCFASRREAGTPVRMSL